MTAINVVRFRCKPGREDEFLAIHREMKLDSPGARRFTMVKTGDRSYCVIGEWDDSAALVAGRPGMINNLNRIRDTLEDLGNGLGVTDPVSGEVVMELKPS
jgi:hypothetical protein